MKVPPVDNSSSAHTGTTEPSQADNVKKSEFEKVMNEVMSSLQELQKNVPTSKDAVQKEVLDVVMGEVNLGLRELHYRLTDLEESNKNS